MKSNNHSNFDYTEINEILSQVRKAPILVIYGGEPKSLSESKRLDKLKAFHFISDKIDYRHYLCGMQYSGVLIEEDAQPGFYNVRYVLTRLRSPDDIVIIFNDYHKDMLEGIVEEMVQQSHDAGFAENLHEEIMGACVSLDKFLSLVKSLKVG